MAPTTLSLPSPQDPTRLSVPKPLPSSTPPSSSLASPPATGRPSRSAPCSPPTIAAAAANTSPQALPSHIEKPNLGPDHSRPQILLDTRPRVQASGNPAPLSTRAEARRDDHHLLDTVADHVHALEHSLTRPSRHKTATDHYALGAEDMEAGGAAIGTETEEAGVTTVSTGTGPATGATTTTRRGGSSSILGTRARHDKKNLLCRVCGCSQSTVVMVLFLIIVVVAAAIGGGVGGSIFATSR